MADSAQYQIEFVSAESDSGESTIVRGITYKPNNAARRQKYYRRPKELEKCENFKRFGISVCILVASALVLWILVLSLLLTELFKRTLELQSTSGRTSVQVDELTNQTQSWHTVSKSIEKDRSLQMAQIFDLERELSNVTARLVNLEKRLVGVEEKATRPHQLFDVVQEQVSTLTSSIAGLNSEVENLKAKLVGFRDDEDNREQALSKLKVNVSTLTQTISTLNKTLIDAHSSHSDTSMNASTILSQAIESTHPEMIAMNESLSKRLRYLSEDQGKDHKLFIELQESLANVSSQVVSLLQNTEAWKTNFNNLELKILTIREQFKASQTKPHEKASSSPKLELTTVSSLCDVDTTTNATRLAPAVDDQPTTFLGTTPLFPEIDILLSATPANYHVT